MALEGVKSDKSEENNGNVPDGKANGVDNKSKQIDPNTAFLRAARAGQLETVVDLLDSGAVKDINTSNSNGLNALHLAAKDGHISVVEELLKRGAIVDAATKKGNTALHIACLAGQEPVARALLGAGAKADAQSAAGFTPLYMAAQENHAGCVKMLLAAGASQTLATEDGFTPLAVAMQQGHDRVVAELLESDTRGKVRLPALHIAAKKNDVKAATLLLENEHNPDACSKSGFTPLHIAAHYGNVGVAKALLAAGADSGRAAKHNITPLHVASKWGQLAMVDLLVENGANIAAVTRDGLTPLHCAARSGHSNVVSRLLQHGAPITSKTKNGLTPLHMSVQGEHVETARVLLTEGAPIDDVTVDYLTALHVAAHCGHVKVAKLLLDRNADANARALNGFTPLHIACKKNRLKVVELLLKYGASKSATTESGLTPLHVASFMGCMNIALVLVGAGAEADACTARGETPLHLAARAHQTDLVRVLLRNNAKVEARAREEQTPLHVAARLGHGDIAALLLQHGADVAAATKDHYTPLHIAAKEGKEEVASILLDNNAPIEAETRKGFTPLHLAAKYGDIGVARLLLARGAQPDAPGKSHITPLHMATYYGHPDIALLLLDKGASPHSLAKNGHSALHIACRHNHPDIAFALLEHDADPSVKSKAGFTPLHMAAQEGHEDCVEMLIERGADVNVPASNGLTPVHLAASEGRTAVLRALLGAGGRCGARTRDGYTPLHAAAHHGHHAAARALVEAGADVTARAQHGFTPLHQASQQGHTLIIQLLLKSNADPNALSANGQTACAIADRLGYISAVEALRPVTENTLSQAVGDTGGLEGKYRVAAPELMQDTFMSDSEDEGGEVECPIQQQQQYRYMNSEAGTLHRARPLEDSVTDGHLYPSNNDKKVATIDRQPLDIGFLVSFVVDARGGAMKAKRRGGVRIVVPPAACAAPTRVTCRAATRRAPAAAPPPLMEGEALASRLLELQPQGAKFLAPVIIEVPIFTSSCKEREIVILRSDTGDTWQDHYLHNNDNPMIQEALHRERLEHGTSGETLGENGERVTRIITCDFPHYLAVVSRVRQEVHIIGPEGGTVSSSHIPQVQALFPPQALTKRIRVGVQAHGAPAALCRRALPRHVAVAPVITVEPRRRKFHRSITLTSPLPKTEVHTISTYIGAPAALCRRALPRHVAVAPVITVEPRRRKFHRSITLTSPLPKTEVHTISTYIGAPAALCRRALPRHVAVAPVITVEPRRRKFHRSITLTSPLPKTEVHTISTYIGAPAALCRRALPRHVAVAPVITVEPRRRKFHRSITLTSPLPKTEVHTISTYIGAPAALCRRALPRHVAVAPVITVEPRRRKFHRSITLTSPLPKTEVHTISTYIGAPAALCRRALPRHVAVAPVITVEPRRRKFHRSITLTSPLPKTEVHTISTYIGAPAALCRRALPRHVAVAPVITVEPRRRKFHRSITLTSPLPKTEVHTISTYIGAPAALCRRALPRHVAVAPVITVEPRRRKFHRSITLTSPLPKTEVHTISTYIGAPAALCRRALPRHVAVAPVITVEPRRRKFHRSITLTSPLPKTEVHTISTYIGAPAALCRRALPRHVAVAPVITVEPRRRKFHRSITLTSPLPKTEVHTISTYIGAPAALCRRALPRHVAVAPVITVEPRRRKFHRSITLTSPLPKTEVHTISTYIGAPAALCRRALPRHVAVAPVITVEPRRRKFHRSITLTSPLPKTEVHTISTYIGAPAALCRRALPRHVAVAPVITVEPRRRKFHRSITLTSPLPKTEVHTISTYIGAPAALCRRALPRHVAVAPVITVEPRRRKFHRSITLTSPLPKTEVHTISTYIGAPAALCRRALPRHVAVAPVITVEPRRRKFHRSITLTSPLPKTEVHTISTYIGAPAALCRRALPRHVAVAPVITVEPRRRKFHRSITLTSPLPKTEVHTISTYIGAPAALCRRALPRHVAVAPVITVEPRRRKFHRSITLTSPLPKTEVHTISTYIGAPAALCRRALPRHVAVAPVITVEPRRRKFHRSITLTSPLPKTEVHTISTYIGAPAALCRRALPRHVAVAPVITVEPRRRKFHRSITLTSPLPKTEVHTISTYIGAPAALCRRALPRHVAVAPVITVEPRRRKFHRSITLTSPLPKTEVHTISTYIGAPAALCRRALPRHVAVAPVITVEPRRRKFHRSITLTSPLPKTENGPHDKQSTSTLRLLCSIMGGQARAVWEDVTGSTPLTVTDDCGSFTTTVSARFWLMNCQNVSDATKLATELYKEMLLVPFEVRIVVLGKRLDALEGRLLVLYITDRYAYETLLQQEHYTEVAHSTSVKFLDSKEVYLEFSGNLVPVTKSGSQPMFKFEAFKDNRVEFPVRVKHPEESSSGRIYFMNEPKVPKGEQSQTPACVLDVELPERRAPRAGKSQADCLNLDQSGFDALKDELSFHSWDHHHHGPIAPPPPPPLNGHTDDDLIITNGDVKYPTKDSEDTVIKPQPNGDTNHVDSNKVKATFDSDEDKTPMNTLEKGDKEKGKKKEGFLGGLADKVKHVFSHSQDEDDKDSPKPKPRESKEKSPPKQKKDKNSPKREDKDKSPPKQQKEKTPKPEEKEKTPPKPAPRLISEDLLEKVDDIFKDLKTKPHQKEKEEDLNSEVYTTRLVVDEDRPANLQNITEEVYEQYANMQPVETPMQIPKKDPFAYPTVCCDGPKGPKHSHEETSTLLDQIEQAKFAAHEKLHDVGDKVQSNVDEGAAKLGQEKEKLHRQVSELKDDLIIKEENFIKSAKDHANDAKHATEDGVNKLVESAHIAHDDINAKAAAAESNIDNEFDNLKSSTYDAYENVAFAVGDTKNNLINKAHTLDFLAQEQAEEIKNRGHEQMSQIGQKAKEGANAVSDTFHAVQDNVNHKAQELKAGAKETADNIKDKTNEKLHDLGESIDSAKEKAEDTAADLKSKAGKEKDKAKKEAKKAKKEGKSFITGLVSNIFGEKEKIEKEVKGKVAEGKDAANNLLDEASAKKDEIKEAVEHKHEELKDGANRLAENVNEKAKEAEKAVHDKKDELQKAAHDKKEEVKHAAHEVGDAIHSKTQEVSQAIHDKKEEVGKAVNDKKEEIANAVQDTTEQVGKSISDKKKEVGQAIHDKKEAIHDKAEEVGKAIHDKTQEVSSAVHDKANEVNTAIHDKTHQVGSAIHDKKEQVSHAADEFGQAVHDKTQDFSTAVHDKAHEVGSAIHDKKEQVSQAAHEFGQAVHNKTQDVSTAVHDKAHEVGSAIHDKKEQVSQAAHEFGQAVHDKTQDVSTVVRDKAHGVGSAIHDKKEQVSHAAHEFGQAVNDKTQDFSNAVHDKAHEVGSAIHDKKEQGSQAAHEFGQAVHDKTQDVSTAVRDKAHEVGSAIHDKKEEVSHAAHEFGQAVHDKTQEVSNAVHNKAHDVGSAIQDKTDEAKHALQNKASELGNTMHDKKESIENAIHDKKAQVQNVTESEMDRIRQTAEQTTEQIKKSAEDTINAAADKKTELQANLSNKFDDLQKQGHDELQHIQNAASDKVGDLQQTSKNAFDHVQDSALSTFDRVESSAKDKVSDAKDQWEDLQSSTRDTYADFRDDVHGLENSAQDTLYSFQSSAGNTFDSLDDSAKEFLGGVQSSTQSFENNSKELFGDMKESFEGFQVSAENQLEDVKGAAKQRLEVTKGAAAERLEDVSERLEGVKEGAKEGGQAVTDAVVNETDKFTSSLNDLGNSVFGSSGKGFMKDSSTKLLESEKAQSSPSPHKKGSGFFSKLRRSP
ncbi:uncharacterized protein LOC133530585 [Cydia pomonella]|uniref:uncharacterized protein LOC133530585 n=1 Tax=Cydia pomonella TaxID=82600 RepID=UPI002ADE4762|nr:uncharacterized protein LOC133530585 [Cydia pomonella]